MIQAAGVCGGRAKRQGERARGETKFRGRKRESVNCWTAQTPMNDSASWKTKREPSWRKGRRVRPWRPRWMRMTGRSLTSLWQTTQVSLRGRFRRYYSYYFFKVSPVSALSATKYSWAFSTFDKISQNHNEEFLKHLPVLLNVFKWYFMGLHGEMALEGLTLHKQCTSFCGKQQHTWQTVKTVVKRMWRNKGQRGRNKAC